MDSVEVSLVNPTPSKSDPPEVMKKAPTVEVLLARVAFQVAVPSELISQERVE